MKTYLLHRFLMSWWLNVFTLNINYFSYSVTLIFLNIGSLKVLSYTLLQVNNQKLSLSKERFPWFICLLVFLIKVLAKNKIHFVIRVCSSVRLINNDFGFQSFKLSRSSPDKLEWTLKATWSNRKPISTTTASDSWIIPFPTSYDAKIKCLFYKLYLAIVKYKNLDFFFFCRILSLLNSFLCFIKHALNLN